MVMGRVVSHKMEEEEDFDATRWLDRSLIRLCRWAGGWMVGWLVGAGLGACCTPSLAALPCAAGARLHTEAICQVHSTHSTRPTTRTFSTPFLPVFLSLPCPPSSLPLPAPPRPACHPPRSRFGDYRKDDPDSFQLRPQLSYYPQFMFNFRRSQFIQVGAAAGCGRCP